VTCASCRCVGAGGGQVIPNSMIDLPAQTSKVAVNVHKCLLAFCGTKKTTYPAASAQVLWHAPEWA